MSRSSLLTFVFTVFIVPLSSPFLFAQGPGVASRVTVPASARGGPVQETGQTDAYHPGRLLIQFTPAAAAVVKSRGTAGLGDFDNLLRATGARNLRSADRPRDTAMAARLGIDRWHILDVPPGDIEALAARYRSNPNIEAASPDYRAFLSVVPNDPIYPSQWGHNNTGQMLSYCWGCGGHPAGSPVGTPGFDSHAEDAWAKAQGYGSPGVVIAILDTGVDVDHPDLMAHLLPGYDFGDDDPDPDDNSAGAGHGTATSGVAGAVANNGLGVAGIAGGCSIMPLKVADSNGSLFFSYIRAALYYAADNGADVVSMSFGAAISSDPATDAALQYAYNAGVTLLAATGNGNKSVIEYPAVHSTVIGVGAASPCGDRKRSSSNPFEVNPGVSTDPNGYTCDGERWWGSSYGVNVMNAAGAVDVIAPTIHPTTDIAGAGGYSSGDYDLWFNGTSCATPYAAGVCGLILSANPSFTNAQVRNQLTGTATDVVNVESGSGWDRYSGYGMVNADAAVGGGGCTAPNAPSNLSAVSGGQTQVDLSWSDNSNNEDNFHIERWTGIWTEIATVGAGVTNYSDTGLTCNTLYEYRVRASNACGFSGYSNLGVGTTDPCGGGAGPVGEVGQVVRNQTGAGADWYTVNLDNAYTNPVAVMKGLSTAGGHKTHLRVRNVGSTSFQWQMEEWDYHDGNHITETCPYIVFEAGRHTLENGTVVEAGNATVGTGWQTINFSSSFSGTPVLLVGVASQNDGAAVVSRTRNLGNGGFQVRLQEEEAADGVHSNETVAWVAIEAGTGTNDGDLFEAGRTPNAVTHENYTVNFSAGFGGSPIFLCHDDTFDGSNTCSTRFRTLNASSATVFIEEEQSADEEVNHITEVVSWLAWGSAGDIVGTSAGGRAMETTTREIVIVPTTPVLAQSRPNPFRTMTTIQLALPASGDIDLRIVDVQGRMVRSLAGGFHSEGEHTYTWDGRSDDGVRVPAGIYFYQLRAGALVETRRMVLLR